MLLGMATAPDLESNDVWNCSRDDFLSVIGISINSVTQTDIQYVYVQMQF